jgi:hypothetical protein
MRITASGCPAGRDKIRNRKQDSSKVFVEVDSELTSHELLRRDWNSCRLNDFWGGTDSKLDFGCFLSRESSFQVLRLMETREKGQKRMKYNLNGRLNPMNGVEERIEHQNEDEELKKKEESEKENLVSSLVRKWCTMFRDLIFPFLDLKEKKRDPSSFSLIITTS